MEWLLALAALGHLLSDREEDEAQGDPGLGSPWASTAGVPSDPWAPPEETWFERSEREERERLARDDREARRRREQDRFERRRIELSTDIPILVRALVAAPDDRALQRFVAGWMRDHGDGLIGLEEGRPQAARTPLDLPPGVRLCLRDEWIWERAVTQHAPRDPATRNRLLNHLPRVSLELLRLERRINEDNYRAIVSGTILRDVPDCHLRPDRWAYPYPAHTPDRLSGSPFVAPGPPPFGSWSVPAGHAWPDLTSFVRAISAAPDDRTSQLVFADWVQEHGEDRFADHLRAGVARSAWRAREQWGEPWLWENAVTRTVPARGPVRDALLVCVAPVSLEYLRLTDRVSRREHATALTKRAAGGGKATV